MEWAQSCCPPERIILCIDACEELYTSKYPIVEGGKSFSTFQVIKKCAEVFLINKSAINPNNLFSLMILRASNPRIIPFTSNIKGLIRCLYTLSPEPVPENPTPLSSIFKTVEMEMRPIDLEETEHAQPLRLVILFGRQGLWVKDKAVPPSNSDLIVDILYLHKRIVSSKERKRLEANLNELQSCVGEHSMFKIELACTYSAFSHMADLLIHPQLRK